MARRRIQGRRFLLLQGPVGPWFARLERLLYTEGAARVTRIAFNGGDLLFHPQARLFKGDQTAWRQEIRELLAQHDHLILFGDCRAYHQIARAAAREFGVEVTVHEEGYLRPHYITAELAGVNAFSHLPKDVRRYQASDDGERFAPPATPASRFVKTRMALYACAYYAAMHLFAPLFPHYHHHRDTRLAREAWCWLKSAVRSISKRPGDRRLLAALAGQTYYVVPLQCRSDFQIRCHSDLDLEQMIAVSVASFAAHAPAGSLLVFKHHPMERGHHDYSRAIATAARLAGVAGRVHYGWDAHLPTLLIGARGCITINSTVGLSALIHDCPVICLGRAVYAMPGLTHAGDLDSFWQGADRPDPAVVRGFVEVLRKGCQFPGSFVDPPCSPRVAVPLACAELLPDIEPLATSLPGLPDLVAKSDRRS